MILQQNVDRNYLCYQNQTVNRLGKQVSSLILFSSTPPPPPPVVSLVPLNSFTFSFSSSSFLEIKASFCTPPLVTLLSHSSSSYFPCDKVSLGVHYKPPSPPFHLNQFSTDLLISGQLSWHYILLPFHIFYFKIIFNTNQQHISNPFSVCSI